MTALERLNKLQDLYAMKLYGKRFRDLDDPNQMAQIILIPVVSAAWDAEEEESRKRCKNAPDLYELAEESSMELFGKHFVDII